MRGFIRSLAVLGLFAAIFWAYRMGNASDTQVLIALLAGSLVYIRLDILEVIQLLEKRRNPWEK